MKKNVKTILSTELLILPDGRILIQNLTQPMAELLHGLNPADQAMASRLQKSEKTYEFSGRT
jgi:hypothetical protein